MTVYAHYHIQWCEPNDVWPKGGWSVYHITGDEIASRIKRDDKGKVVERHSWCGYVGMFTTMAQVADLIERHQKWTEYANGELAKGKHSYRSFEK